MGNNLYGNGFIEKLVNSGYKSPIYAMAEIIDNSVDHWIHEFSALCEPACKILDNSKLSPTAISMMGYALLEGGILLAKVKKDNSVIIDQLNAFHEFLRISFSKVSH